MIISRIQIERIREAIKNRYNALIFKVAGPDSLTDEDIKKLIELGYIKPEEVEALLTDAYFVGRGRNVSDPRQRPYISLDEFKRKYKDLVQPMSPVEKFAIRHIMDTGGSSIIAIRDKARGAIEHIVNTSNLVYRNEILDETVRPVLVEGIATDKQVRQIGSDLRRATGDMYRDWQRVAVTEVATAMNLGEADAIIARNKGKPTNEIYVYKRVNLDNALCPHCRKAYMEADGVTPKVYKLSELQANGTNYGRPAAEYLPTITPIHPQCRCSLVELPNGWGFDHTNGQTIYMGPHFIYSKSK